MATILEGIRVLDFTQGFSGSLATMMLADNGAEVIKVEPPGGDPSRVEAAWLMWNRGKQSVVLDLATPEGQSSAASLAQTVDVVIENFGPGVAERLGVGHKKLSESNPGLVYCSITALGTKGAFADLPVDEGMAEAACGAFVQMGGYLMKDRPVYRVRPMGSYGAANFAAQGIIAALRARDKTGLGQRVETTLYQGYIIYDYHTALRQQIETGMSDIDVSRLTATRSMRVLNFPYMVVRCKDGLWLQMANMAARLFPNWLKVMGLDHLYEDPRFKNAPVKFEDDEDALELRRIIVTRMLEKTSDEWMELMLEHGVACDRFLTTQQFMDHPQMLHNEAVVDVDDPVVGATKQIGPIGRFSETPSQIGRPAPQLGEHTEAVLASLVGPRVDGRPRSNGSNGTRVDLKHPLDGMLVLDFSSWLAAPIGPALLADMGARVIKIEPPHGDEFRPLTGGLGRTFQGKESFVVDLKTEEGRSLIRPLIAKADALLHNMRGDTPKRVGIDYETVREINPNIIYHYAGSYGSTGPGAGRAAFHPIGGCLSGGVLWQLGRGHQPPPPDQPMSVDEVIEFGRLTLGANEGSPDITSAIIVGTALMLALFARERTGKGQYLETGMLVSNAYICSSDFVRYDGKPPRPLPDASFMGLHALYRHYDTSDGQVFLSCPTEEQWRALCDVLGQQTLIEDPRFVDADARMRYDETLIAALSQAFKERDADHWDRELRSRGVPCVRADRVTIDDFFLSDPSVRENEFIVERDRPISGRMWRQGPAVKFSVTPGRAELAHGFGEDSEAILAETGVSPDEARRLVESGVVITAEPQAVS
jgi:crotonobetainyl-CoA:carnitine CoA-transferase CaiB-like acyl-CoA transferase